MAPTQYFYLDLKENYGIRKLNNNSNNRINHQQKAD